MLTLRVCVCGPSAPQKLQAVKGLSEAKAEKMVEAARKVTDTGNWMTGSDAMLKVCTILLALNKFVDVD